MISRFVTAVLMVTLAWISTSCSHKKIGAESTTDDSDPAMAEPASTSRTRCRDGRFSPEGRRLIAICVAPTHSHPQLYEIDLKGGKDRRMTWQDGEVLNAGWSDERNVLYVSTTDEIKEDLFPKVDAKGLKGDLYESDLYGQQIRRRTNLAGWDGDAVAIDANEWLYVHRSGSRSEIRRWQRRGDKSSIVLESSKTLANPLPVPNGRFLYLEGDPPALELRGWDGKKSRTPMPLTATLIRPGPQPGLIFALVPPTATAGKWRVELRSLDSNCTTLVRESADLIQDFDIFTRSTPARLVWTRVVRNEPVLSWENLESKDLTCAP